MEEPLMTDDFYCEEVLSGRTSVRRVFETENVLAYHHTRPFWPVHIVVIPKRHIDSLIALDAADKGLLLELMEVVRLVASDVVANHGACRVVTNLGEYQDSKHLHWHVGSGTPLR
jgi:histidine triad (HIT) family protein